eukprot:4128908-Lingulodinium_polyedra.AAC.1
MPVYVGHVILGLARVHAHDAVGAGNARVGAGDTDVQGGQAMPDSTGKHINGAKTGARDEVARHELGRWVADPGG